MIVEPAESGQVNGDLGTIALRGAEGEPVAPGVRRPGQAATQSRADDATGTAMQPVAQAVSRMMHEVRSPLATMYASLEMLSGYLTLNLDEVGQLVVRMQRSLARLDALSANLAVWSALETGRLELYRAAVPIDHVIDAALELVQPLLGRRGQTLERHYPRAVPLVYGDEDRLIQVLVNLLSNACRYGAEGDRIALTVATEGDRVRVRVTDHGDGIAVEDQERIFQNAVRGTGARSSGPAGLGIGLHIVKTIVEAHGGAVGVKSRRGQGADFWFTLPRCEVGLS